MRLRGSRGVSRSQGAVALVIVGALAFGLYIAFLAWSSSSLPVKERPFGDYATVVSAQFNGTEIYYKVEWNAGSGFLPLYAQITSPQTDEANSPVCDLGLSSVAQGQLLDLPFAVTAPKQALASVDLSIAVRQTSNMTEFTIVYHIGQIAAQPGTIPPSHFACSQPASTNM